MRCRHVVDAVTGIALEGAALEDALRVGAVKRCGSVLHPGDGFCPQCGGTISWPRHNSMWNRLTIGISLLSALTVVAVALVSRLRDSRQDPFGGYSVDQVLPSLTGLHLPAFDLDSDWPRSAKSQWDTKSFAFSNSDWDRRYEFEVHLTSAKMVVAVKAKRKFGSDRSAAEKEFDRVLELFRIRYGDVAARHGRKGADRAYFECFPDCVASVRVDDLVGDWYVEAELMPRCGWSGDFVELSNGQRILPVPETNVKGSVRWNRFVIAYKEQEKDVLKCLNGYISASGPKRDDAQLLACESGLSEMNRLCDSVEEGELSEIGTLELAHMRKIVECYEKYVRAGLQKREDMSHSQTLDALLDIYFCRREFLRQRESQLREVDEKESNENLDQRVQDGDLLDEDEAEAVLAEAKAKILNSPLRGSKETIGLSLKTVEELATRGYVPAQYFLGYEFLNELSFLDVTNAVRWLTKAADRGCMPAARELGKYFYRKKHGGMFRGGCTQEEVAMAVSYLERAAKEDDGEACYYLGECYGSGTGVAKDERKAQEWFRKAVVLLTPEAESGDAAACEVLAWCYSGGKGVERSLEEGMKWMHKSTKRIRDKFSSQRGVVKERDMKRSLPTISGLSLGGPLPASFETSECADGSVRAEFVPDGIFDSFGGGVCYALPKSRTVALINIAKDAESADVAAQEFEKTKRRLEDILGLKFVIPQGFSPKHVGSTMVLKEMRAVIEKGDENHQVVTIRIVRCKDDSIGCIVEFLDVEAGKRLDDEKDE